MRDTYAASDIGLFPDRCEGGNNMVMCEYMGCGRPVIASSMTGHHDIVTPDNAICLENYEPIVATLDGAATGVWFEPSVDEIICKLEQAYDNRQALESIGAAAGKSMSALSWSEAARKFHALAQQIAALKPLEKIEIRSADEMSELAAGYFTAGCHVEAEQAYSAMLRRVPLDPDVHNNLGTVLDRLGRYAGLLCITRRCWLCGPILSPHDLIWQIL